MPHHDFYSSLGLDRDRDAASLAASIDWRLADSNISPAQRDELQVAQKILGDERRRALYDARLDDPTAPTIDVASLRELADIDFGPAEAGDAADETATTSIPVAPAPAAEPDAPQASAGEEPKAEVKPKPKQYYPDTDPNAEAVSPVQQYPVQSYPAQYPGPPPGYYPPQVQGADKPRRGKTVPVILGVLLLLGALGAGGWWFWNNQSEPWEPEDQVIADAFPRIVGEENGQRGWLGMRCTSKEPEEGQDARIRCADKQLGVSVMDYGTVEARDPMLPDEDPVVLTQGECEVHSYERAGQSPPAYVLAPQGQDGQFLLVVNGEDAENKRLHLNMCDKTRE